MSAIGSEDLVRKSCVPCEGGIPPLSPDQAHEMVANVYGWELTVAGRSLRRRWVAKNFVAAIDFFKTVAALAEQEGHHPDLHLEGYRNVTIEITTHAIGGLSENDFILAAKINELPIAVRKSAGDAPKA